MRHHLPLTEAEKEHIFLARLDGRTLSAIAQDLGCSIACVRKWWRIGRRHGQDGLRAPRRGRRPRGILSEFAPQVVARALTVKQEHPRWGPNRVLVELGTAITLTGLALPSRSRLATFFRAHCPACVASAQPRQPPKARLQRPTAVHEVWQFDHQEGIRLGDGQIATVSTLRDWVGGALVGSQATPVQTKHHWRKLTVAEIRGIVRAAFAEWLTLPDALQTDNELGFAGSPTDPFPSQFTLWLAGLGVTHACIRPACPTDQAQVERSHRTLANFAQDPTKLATLATFQMALDHERAQYNQAFPSRASDCAG
ncbi:MAG: DDE-type integrase/transposase/recombinase, partial [Chloroflexi bacterium]|nr:DDE-type integrase/transposase/recombinase [Chloroflexota bacterium]